MRLPRKGEKGFTLIELLIVVAILGVLAAVIIPNVGRFIGKGQTEAAATEFANVQTAVIAMMTDNELSELPTPVDGTTGQEATSDMSAFPDKTTSLADKGFDLIQTPDNDKIGYLLYAHDMTDDGLGTVPGDGGPLANYVTTATTKGTYTVDEYGTVEQVTHGYE